MNLVKKGFKKLLSYCSISILHVLGWKSLDNNIIDIMNKNKYLVCVFSHTSYYDFFFMVLYYLSYPKELKNLKTLIKPDYFKYIGWFLYRIGGIPSTNIAYKNGGNVIKIVDVLKSSKSSQLLISPKGTICKGDWRSGYFHIAKLLKAPLIAIGVDYDDKKINIGSLIDYQLEENEIKHHLYRDLSNIVPLYPEREMMKIRKYNYISVIDPNRFIGLYFLAIIGISIYVYIN